jgi:hypothetical protein
VTISQTAIDVRARARQGLIGMPATTGVLLAFLTMINEDPQAVQSDQIVVDTATHNHLYTQEINGIACNYQADAATTKAEIADGLAAAINAEPAVRGQVAAISDGVDTVTLSGLIPGLAYTLSNVDALCTATSIATAAEAAAIPFGRLVISDGLHPDGDGTPLGKLAQSSAFAAQEAEAVVTYHASEQYTVIVRDVKGAILAAVNVDADTDSATTAAAIRDALNAALPANTVIVTLATATLTFAAEVAGLEFSVGGDGSAGGLVISDTVGPTAATSLARAAAGISLHSMMDEAATIGAEQGEYPANHGFRAMRAGPVWVERPGAVSAGDPVYVELSGANAGKFYNTGSATRVLLPSAIWDRDGRTATDGLAVVRIDL